MPKASDKGRRHRHRHQWLIVEYKNPGGESLAVGAGGGPHQYELVREDRVLRLTSGRSSKPQDDQDSEELYTGKAVEVLASVDDEGRDAPPRRANVVMVSDDHAFLQMEYSHLKNVTKEINHAEGLYQPNHISHNDERRSCSPDNEDFEGSESDWTPDYDESVEVSNKRKRRRLSASGRKKCPTPKLSGYRKYIENHNKSRISDTISHKLTQALNTVAERSQNVVSTDSQFFDEGIFESTMRLHSDFRDVECISVQNVIVGDSRIPPMTFDQQTQTEGLKYDEDSVKALMQNQKLLRTEMMFLYKTIDDIKKQMEAMKGTMAVVGNLVEMSNQNQAGAASNADVYEFSPEREGDYALKEKSSKENTMREWTDRNSTPDTKNVVLIDGAEMIPIGSGETLIPKHIYNQIKWNSYTSATRKLLMAVFPRRTLATHSLTGKSSPAFTNRPAKMKLDVKKISDIVMTVSQMCDVQENLVRNTITTKCSDENKMFRTRQKKMKNKQKDAVDQINCNQENEDPEDEFIRESE